MSHVTRTTLQVSIYRQGDGMEKDRWEGGWDQGRGYGWVPLDRERNRERDWSRDKNRMRKGGKDRDAESDGKAREVVMSTARLRNATQDERERDGIRSREMGREKEQERQR